MPKIYYHRKKNLKIRLVKRQEVLMPTVCGWALIMALSIGLTIFIVTNIHPFLAVNSPIKADALVVEGWIPDYALKRVKDEYQAGNYRQIITTGAGLERGILLSEYKTFAEASAASLKILGLPDTAIISVPAPVVVRDRSYQSALEFANWLKKSNLQIKSINIFSFDVHTRRSWLLFKKVLEPEFQVGAIAADTEDYNPKKWWTSSEGFRSVIYQGIAYVYAQFFNLQA